MLSDFFKTALRDEQQGVSHDPNIGSNEIKYVDNDFLYYYTWKFIFNCVFDVQANSPSKQKLEQCVVCGLELIVHTPASGII